MRRLSRLSLGLRERRAQHGKEQAVGGSIASGFFGGFGRRHPMDLTGYTHFTFWIHPDAAQAYTLEINLQDDDNGDDIYEGAKNNLGRIFAGPREQ